MKFLLDAQLPRSLLGAFADAGHEALHVAAIGLMRASDGAIWDYARRESCVLVTKDEDFAVRWVQGDRGVPVVWIRIGNCRSRELIARVRPHLAPVGEMLSAGETLIEVR